MKHKTINNLEKLNVYMWDFSNYISDKQIQITKPLYKINSVLPTINISDVFSVNALKEEERINPIHGNRYLKLEVSKGGFEDFLLTLTKLNFLDEDQKLIGYNTSNLSNLDEAAIVEISREENKYNIEVKKIKVKPDFNSGIPIFGTYIIV